MTSSDLHALVWRLRQRIGDVGPDARIIVNRKGLGYLIDTDVVDVAVMDLPRQSSQPPPPPGAHSEAVRSDLETSGSEVPAASSGRTATVEPGAVVEPQSSPVTVGPGPEGGAIDPQAVVPVTSAAAANLDPREVDARSGSASRFVFGRNKFRRWASAAAVVALFVAAGFVGGSVMSDAPPANDDPIASESPSATPRRVTDRDRAPKNSAERRPGTNQARKNRRSSTSNPVAIAAPPASGPALETAPPASGRPHQAKPPTSRQAVALPPPPTRYLYHLYNSENGDHFVTTDGGAVTEHEAKGYEGGAIARVYVAPEKDTKAIALNFGSAFIFIDSAPKTDPASITVPLWLAKNNAGDFFYSTSKSEASRDGWSAALVGYVRTL
jgi:hypothetical protein